MLRDSPNSLNMYEYMAFPRILSDWPSYNLFTLDKLQFYANVFLSAISLGFTYSKMFGKNIPRNGGEKWWFTLVDNEEITYTA